MSTQAEDSPPLDYSKPRAFNYPEKTLRIHDVEFKLVERMAFAFHIYVQGKTRS